MLLNDNKIKLRIVIVNYNTSDSLYKCIDSINFSDLIDFKLEVFVVDNNSFDNSITFLEKKVYDNFILKLIKNSKNLGFAKACNQGAEGYNGDFLLFLNPDCYLEQNVISEVVKYFISNQEKRIGVLGIKLLDNELNPTTSYCYFPTTWNWFYTIIGLDRILPKIFKPVLQSSNTDEIENVDLVMGSFYLIKNSLFQKLQGFDERFFVYYEEVDLSFRIKLEGYKNVHYPLVKAIHLGGASSNQFKVHRLVYNMTSRWLYWKKHKNSFNQIIHWILFGLEFFSRILYSISHFDLKKIIDIFKSYVLFFKSLKS
jgi:N-acetylglucosaminyl-diphospho-decaprenol L-rhamnosyltransferase